MNLDVLAHEGVTASEAPFEAVERKGRGHPDTICDLLAEQVSKTLERFYLRECGRVLHYNVDKALLVDGRSEPRFSGGKIIEPTKFYLGGGAISSQNGRRFDLDSLIEHAISGWLKDNLRFLRLNENLVWRNEIQQGAASLNSVEDRKVSNDTSVGVGYWPLSPLEQMTLAIEEHMNSSAFKRVHPASGEDIKVMALRRGKAIEIVLACAIVDRYVGDVADYQTKKAAILNDVTRFVNETYGQDDRIALTLNALDDPARGLDGLYLTVTGLSCEGGDSGQVGRGNRVNGLISFLRPQTMEAWAGKNPKSHVGRIYSFAAQSLAQRLSEEIPEIKEATVVLVGKIGSPVDRPADVFADVKMWGHCHGTLQRQAADVLNAAIADGAVFQPDNLTSAPRVRTVRDGEHGSSKMTEGALHHDATASA
jgi:S-adenosylmethionine synthetase